MLTPHSSYFGYVYARTRDSHLSDPDARLELSHGGSRGQEIPLLAGQYFCCAGPAVVSGGCGIIIERLRTRPMFTLGGPVEAEGRLRYIDGCRDSLLIPPVVKGDACFNALYFPPGTDQTQHTHPSLRIGMVVSGRGQCVTPEGVHELVPGKAFVIEPGGLHAFRTGKEAMAVVAFHPDSDFGPDHADHPMVNRTIVDGVSASLIPEIQTR